MKKFKRHLVTAALPYANGPLHIGHLAGAYIPADIYARYLRLKGEDVKFVCGSDEHGVPITIKAKQEGVTPKDIIDRYHFKNKASFEKLGITFDIYSRTSSEMHFKTASDFFLDLYNKGEFIEKTTEQYYDEEAKQFLADRYITGTCPHCNYDKAFGDQCESCGTSLNPNDLIQPKSALSGNIPVRRKTKHWYLPLDKYEPFLRKWILEENKDWKPNVYGQCKSWLDQKLQPRAVSRDLDWGIPLPIEDAEGKVLYVWFDAPIGYISATKELAEKEGFDWELYWKDKETKLVHFIGKDNIVFHCIVFPAMLNAEGSYILPDNVPANEYLNLEGGKLSTSRNYAIWVHEYLEAFKGKEDVLRYVICANTPETKDSYFNWEDYQARNNNELLAILGNFVNRALVLTHKYYNGEVPDLKEDGLTQFDKDTLKEINEKHRLTQDSLDNFRFREALKYAMDVARTGNKYLADTEPWSLFKTDKERVKNIMYIALQITANLTIIFEPFLPFTCDKLRKWLNIDALGWEACGGFKDEKINELLTPGHRINKPQLLFEKVEDSLVEKQRQKLTDSTTKEAAKAEAIKENISFEDFTTLDIRTATILKAEKVPKTKKLLKLELDTGIDTRTVVSGIAEYYEPEQIIGQQVSVLLNLKPRKIRGIESQGMILMAESPDGKLTFIMPEDNTDNGSLIK